MPKFSRAGCGQSQHFGGFGRRWLGFFAKTHVSDAFNGASSSPGRALGELAGKAIGSRQHETRRDEARLPRPWKVHQQVP